MINPENSSILLKLSKYFREKRNRKLGAKISYLYNLNNKPVEIIDLGGLPEFWKSVPNCDLCKITIINNESGANSQKSMNEGILANIEFQIGDATLLEFADNSFDLALSNSMLEHLLTYENMSLAANEMSRVGKSGWIQVPAFEFPLEVHFMLPFIHWLSPFIQVKILRLVFPRFRRKGYLDTINIVEFVKPITKKYMREIFPNAGISSEKFMFLNKSHIAEW